MKIGFYAGSFDPFTNGHLAIVKEACKIFDVIIIGIGLNPNKERRIDRQVMKQAIDKVMEKEGLEERVEVVIYDEMTVDVAKKYHTDFLIRGIRNGMDYEYEENIALINKEISGLGTLYFRADNLGYISSSMVMGLLNHGKDITKYVPEDILIELNNI